MLRVGNGRFLRVETHSVRFPSGQIIDDWGWVVTPDYVNVVAVTGEGEFLCFRQTKYAAQGETLALVGGYLESDEEPLAAAQRELLEETGYKAESWQPLGSFVVDGNRGCGTGHLFLATGATWAQPIDADDLEEQELLRLSRTAVTTALMAGEFQVLAWGAALGLALLRLGENEKSPPLSAGSSL